MLYHIYFYSSPINPAFAQADAALHRLIFHLLQQSSHRSCLNSAQSRPSHFCTMSKVGLCAVQVRNNIMVALTDMTVQYAVLVDAHIPRLAACLADPNELVRRQALALLASLLSRVSLLLTGLTADNICPAALTMKCMHESPDGALRQDASRPCVALMPLANESAEQLPCIRAIVHGA